MAWTKHFPGHGLHLPQADRLLAGLAWAGLVLLIGGGLWLNIELFWSLRPREHAPPATLPVDPSVTASGVAQAHLFGLPGSGPKQEAAPPAEYKLLGVLAERSQATGAAILLVDGEKRPLVVRLGQEIAPGVRLTGVGMRQVDIDRNGTRLTLELPSAPGPAVLPPPSSRKPAFD